jgi:FkbM family methyltransferase
MSFKQQALRVADYLSSKAFAFNGRMPTYFNGEWLWLHKNSWTSLYLRYEANTARILRANLGLGDTFWDVGANLGLFSLSAAKIVGSAGSVVSFEPSPAAFDLLSKNVERHRSIKAFPYGIGNENSKALMSVQGASTGASFVKEVVELTQVFHERIPIVQVPVSTYKMDTLLDQISSRPNLIKIDIEGYEVEALKGAEYLLDQVRPVLVIEIHPLQLTMSGSHESNVFEILKRHGYLYEIFNRDQQWALYSIIAKPKTGT